MAGDSGAERGAHGVQHSRRRFVAAAGAVTAGAWAAPSIRTVAAAATQSAPTSVAFFGINQVTRSLYAVDVSTGAWTLIGSTGQTNPLGLAFNPDDGVLYGCQNNSAPEDATYTVDTATGTWTLVGAAVNTTGPQGLGYDSSTGTMYAVDLAGIMFTVNLATGEWTAFGATGLSGSTAELAYDSTSGVMYGVSRNNLYTVDLGTGDWTLVGATGVGQPLGLVHDPVNDEMYGADYPGNTYSVNRATGAYTLIGASGVGSGCRGMGCVVA